MNNYFRTWKELKKELGIQEILDGLIASIFYTLVILLPSTLIFSQIISMYYHLLTLWTILIIVSIMGLSVIQLLLWKKSMVLKKPDLFDNYIIVSPSLWWDDESLLKYKPTLYFSLA